MTVMPGSKLIWVLSAKDLNPYNSMDRKNILKTRQIAYSLGGQSRCRVHADKICRPGFKAVSMQIIRRLLL